jgi:SAM-dependent methyltransferase
VSVWEKPRARRATRAPRPSTNLFDDEQIAASYDAASEHMYAPAVLDPAVDLLADHARGGKALELGIGTGRVALALRDRGIEVHGIDRSEAMVARLHAKPGGTDVPVTIGDFATARADGPFRVVYAPFNCVTNLTTQDEQVACFGNVAAHLEPGGTFVAEVFVPQLRRLPPGERFVPFHVSATHLGIDEYDVVAQRCSSHHTYVEEGRLTRFVSDHRYVWPAELDLMAELAGLRLVERWGGWRREPFSADSMDHISVWRKT